MISATQAALTGLQAFTTKLQSNANNIANSDTNGFKKTVVTNSSISPQGVKAQVSQLTTPGPIVHQETETGTEPVELSNVDLAKEIVDMNLNSTLYKANLKTLENVNDMTGMLLKLKS